MAKSSQGKEPDWWPRDPFGYVFLARVVEKLGAALHSDWTGTETTIKEIEPLPRELKDASPVNLCQAEDLLQRHRPDLGRPAVIGWNKFSDEGWKIACGLDRWLRPALARLHATQSEILKRNEAGELELKIQSRSAGPWRDFNKDWWNTDKWRSHFDRCRIDPEYPSGNRPSWNREDNDHWIFAISQSVEEVLKHLADHELMPARKVSTAEINDFVRNYFNSTSHPTMNSCENKWPHGCSARDLLRNAYRAEAKKRDISVKEGRPRKLAK